MKAILLAAGLGSRLRPLTNVLPKCLVPVRGRPLLAYWLDLLAEYGVNDVLINLHYKSELVERFIDSLHSPLKITLVKEEVLLGTGGTVLANKEFCGNEAFMLIHADNLSRFDVNAFMARHTLKRHMAPITMMTFRTDRPAECGIVDLDAQGLVHAFYEKVKSPPGNLANGAVYICEPSVIKFLEGLGEKIIDFSTAVLPAYVGKINTFANTTYHRDIGTLTSYEKAQNEFPFSKHRPIVQLTQSIAQLEPQWQDHEKSKQYRTF